MTIDPVRLARAVHLDAEAAGDGRYRVVGGAQMHHVDLRAADGHECDCADYRVRASLCKHVLRAHLAEGDPEVLTALRTLVPRPKARAA